MGFISCTTRGRDLCSPVATLPVLDKISASERRILMTNWIGTAWERFCQNFKDAIRASFIKYGIALPTDGSQDALINIRGLNNYTIPPWQSNPSLNPPQGHAASEALTEALGSDSECYTEGTLSNCGSDDDLDMVDARAEEIEVMVGGTNNIWGGN